MSFTLETTYVTETCCYDGCGVQFAFTRAFYKQVRNDLSRWWYCPNGHRQHYTGKSDEQKLREAEARETALRDQLDASIRDAETARQALLRDRQRFANGVCPCCNRSFDNVRRHMASQHPEFPAAELAKPQKYECSCGARFASYRGLRIHQGAKRPTNWSKPGQPAWRSHLTVGAAR